MTKHAAVCLFLMAFLAAPVARVSAQTENSEPRRVSFYRHVEPGQATMRVNVWGDVHEPGQYEIQAGTDMLELLFLAGGPDEGIDRSTERRTTTVQVSRQTNNAWTVVFEAPLEDLTSFQRPYPALLDGDAVNVQVRLSRRFGWRDAFTVVGALGTLALVIDRITR